MLTHLRIQNFAIIDQCEIELQDNFSVLTGETGAGKSILIDAISLLLGKQANEEFIKSNCDECIVEGVFKTTNRHDSIKDYMSEGNDELIIFRKITKGKGSVARINNQTTPLKTLKKIMAPFASIIGQHDQYILSDEDQQLQLLDEFNISTIKKPHEQYKNTYRQYQTLKNQLNTGIQNKLELEQKLDFMAFQIQDIESQQFIENEEIELESTKKTLKNREIIQTNSYQTIKNFQTIIENIDDSIRCLSRLCDADSIYENSIATLNQQKIEIEDQLDLLKTNIQQLNHLDDANIEQIESRLDLIFKYKSKYKTNTISDLLIHLETLKNNHKNLLDITHNTKNIEEQLKKMQQQLVKEAKQLNSHRNTCGKTLATAIQTKLEGLIPNCHFQIQIKFDETKLTESGGDHITFLVAPNPGEPLKPLHKIASGGELSRIMLAIKTVFFNQNPVKTLIFDEIDTGVSGITAIKIGEYLKLIAKNTQVLCITHLPQVANFADHHFVIKKEIKNNQTKFHINLLQSPEKSSELQRMIGGKTILKKLK